MKVNIALISAFLGLVACAMAGPIDNGTPLERFDNCKIELMKLQETLPFSKPMSNFERSLRRLCPNDVLVAIQPKVLDYISAPKECQAFSDKVAAVLQGPVCGKIKWEEIGEFHNLVEVGSVVDRYIGTTAACMKIIEKEQGPVRVPGHMVPT